MVCLNDYWTVFSVSGVDSLLYVEVFIWKWSVSDWFALLRDVLSDGKMKRTEGDISLMCGIDSDELYLEL